MVTLYHHPLSRVEAVLAEGDGQSFAALAQDPLLRRTDVMTPPGEFSYRAQRPVWGYLTWIGSGGQANLTPWVLAALTVLSCGAAVAAVGWLLRRRRVSPWWALLILVFGAETLTEFTPELLGLALLIVGIVWWQRGRVAPAVAALAVAALTRETMLVGVAALGVWSLAGPLPAPGRRLRAVAPLAVPFGAYAAWVVLVTARTGRSPFGRSEGRLGAPGAGLLSAVQHAPTVGEILGLVALASAICVVAVRYAPRDVLTWVAVAYLGFAALLGDNVWMTNSGFTRTLLPLYTLGLVAVLGGLHAHRADARAEAGPAPTSPSRVLATVSSAPDAGGSPSGRGARPRGYPNIRSSRRDGRYAGPRGGAERAHHGPGRP